MATRPADVSRMQAGAGGFVPLEARLVPGEPLAGYTDDACFLLRG